MHTPSFRRLGFTLIELMVTVAIIGILASIITVASAQLQRQSRDSEREGDVAVIMNALEKYYDKNGEYPSNVDINPAHTPANLPSFDGVKALLPSLTDNDLTGPGDYQFYSPCANTDCSPSNSSSYWGNYRSKQYVYVSRYDNVSADTWFQSSPGYGTDTGWGCTLSAHYQDPGFILAWRREQDGIWVFKRSVHGKVEIQNYGTGPVAPQTCTFS